MSITSLFFLIFIFFTLIIYYIIPKKFQWIVLLAASLIFYLISSIKGIVFVLLTSASIYASTIIIQSFSDKQKILLKNNKAEFTKEEKRELKEKNKKRQKIILIGTLLLNFGVMVVVKYSHFMIDTVNSVLGLDINNSFSLIVPLGLSFYTFQATGYLINVYWGNYRAEKNFLKVLLFVSFFPQITQGPISEFNQLSEELFSEHQFYYKNYSWGFWRMLWGFMKKMVIANTLSLWVSNTFENYNTYTGIATLMGAIMYSIQIYADFSGYMDIMCGYCEMLGIKLAENFERPYFSKSVAEYWRRWHITLGAWFKNYIYYPIGISKWNRNLGKKLTSKFGKAVGKNLPATIALIVVWLITGLWHGASWSYVAWGGVNGFFIIVSMWMEPINNKMKSALKISDENRVWRAFQTIRTFILVTFIKVLPEVGTLSEGLGLWKKVLTDYTVPTGIAQFVPFINDTELKRTIIVLLMITLWVVISLLQRKKIVREIFAKRSAPFRMVFLITLFLLIIIIGGKSSNEGVFMYAGF